MASWQAQEELLALSIPIAQSTTLLAGGATAYSGSTQACEEGLKRLLQLGDAAEAPVSSSAACVYSQVARGAAQALSHLNACSSSVQLDAAEQHQRELLVLRTGVECLLVFIRHNISGPWRPAPPSPIELLAPALANAPAAPSSSNSQGSTTAADSTHEPSSSPSSSEPQQHHTKGLGEDSQHPHERWAGQQLALDGEELIGSCGCLQYLHLADLLLVQPLFGAPLDPTSTTTTTTSSPDQDANGHHDDTSTGRGPAWQPGAREQMLSRWPSWAWWALRATSQHQALLDGRSAQLWARVQLLGAQLLGSWLAPALRRLDPSSSAAVALTRLPPALLAAASVGAAGAGGAAREEGAEEESSGVAGLAGNATLMACLLMELSLAHYAYGHVEPAERLLSAAGDVLGLQVQLTGAMGKRTLHQIDAKAQLVVVALRDRKAAPATATATASTIGNAVCVDVDVSQMVMGVGTAPPSTAAAADADATASIKETDGLKASGAGEDGAGAKQQLQQQEEEDVFIAPKLLDEEGKELSGEYSGVEQALLLCWAQHVRTATAQDELQVWQMAPYVEAVLRQQRSQPMLQARARLMKVHHEKDRNRTRERALLHMEQLVEVLMLPPEDQAGEQQQQHDAAANPGSNGTGAGSHSGSADAEAARRLPYVHCSALPLGARLRRDLAHQYLAMGFVGAAVKLYESIEAWDALVLCYRLLEKRNLADEIIRRRLKVTPDNPSLWCGLGDLHLDDQYYETAWERSGKRHARSKRSLGRSALRRKDWAAAAEHYQAALRINPLNPDAWFSLGYAYLKVQGRQMDALQAFTRVTQQQPDHAEAWNNLAAIFLDLKRPKEAFSALSECVKHKRESWQMWENYASAALRSNAPLQAVKGIGKVLQLSGGQKLPIDTALALVDLLAAPSDAQQPQQQGDAADDTPEDSQQGGDDLGSWLLDLPGLPPHAAAAAGTAAADEGEESQPQASSQFRQDVEVAAERTRQQWTRSLGQVLKDAVNQPCCSPALWGCLGKYYAATGQQESAKEALLKQVRALTGTSYKSDEKRFVEMAAASVDLAQAYVQLYTASTSGGAATAATTATSAGVGAVRELAAARMHLRGVLKQSEQAFAEHEAWRRMDEVLQQVLRLEEEAVAASKAKAAAA